MIYSKEIKKDPKGFVIKSTNQRILLNGKLIKIIKYKEYFGQVLVFYKQKGKIYQKYFAKDYFKERVGSNIEMTRFILQYKNILLLRKVKELSRRYLKRYRFYEYLI